jgi:hypothetical protein
MEFVVIRREKNCPAFSKKNFEGKILTADGTDGGRER